MPDFRNFDPMLRTMQARMTLGISTIRLFRAWGEPDPSTDLMAWRDDQMRMPACMLSEYLRRRFLETGVRPWSGR